MAKKKREISKTTSKIGKSTSKTGKTTPKTLSGKTTPKTGKATAKTTKATPKTLTCKTRPKTGKTTASKTTAKPSAPAITIVISYEVATDWATALVDQAGDRNIYYLFAELYGYVGDDEDNATTAIEEDGWTPERAKAELIEHLAGVFMTHGWFGRKTLQEYLADKSPSLEFFMTRFGTNQVSDEPH